MAAANFEVVEIQGALYLQTEDGELTALTADFLAQNNIVVEALESGAGQIVIDGQVVTLTPAQFGQLQTSPGTAPFVAQQLDGGVYESSIDELAQALDNAGVAATPEAEFLSVLDGDGDILENLEATAAGITGGGAADNGNSFVRVSRIAEEVEPLQFEFNSVNLDTRTLDSFEPADTAEDNTPQADLEVDVPDLINLQTPPITGQTSLGEGDTVTVIFNDANGDTFETIIPVLDDGSFAFSPPEGIADGEFSGEIIIEDEAGNAVSAPFNGAVDLTAPQITLDPIAPASGDEVVVTGTTDLPEGSTVTVTIVDANGDEQTVTTETDNTGNITADIAIELAEGDYTVTAEATDAAGNTTTTSVTGTVDNTPAQLTLDVVGDTNDTTPTISGTTDLPAGNTVTVTVTDSNGEQQTIEVETQADGSFSVAIPQALSEGSFTLEAEVTDSAGNTSTVTQTGGAIDTTAPVITVDNPGAQNNPTPNLSGTTDLPANSTVTLTVTDSNDSSQTLTATVTPDGNFSVAIPQGLSDGSFTVVAQATDSAGNSTSVTQTGGAIDTSAPVISLDTPGPQNDTTPTLSGTTDMPAGSTVALTVTDSTGASQTMTTTVAPDGSFSAEVTLELSEGNFTVEAQVTDDAGNTTSVTQTGGSIDTTAPVLTLSPQSQTDDSTPLIDGQTDLPAGTAVTVLVTDNAGNTQTLTTTVQTDGSFSAQTTAELTPGSYSVTAQASDAAGNLTSVTDAGGSLNADSTQVTLDPQGETNDATPLISGSTTLSAGSQVTINITDTNGDTQQFTAIVQPDNSFTASVPVSLPEGPYSVTAQVSDNVGNLVQATDTGGLIDTTAPVITLDNLADTNDPTPLIAGSTDAVAGSEVTVIVTADNGVSQTITTQVEADGSFAVQPDNPLAEGTFTVTASVSDTAGNSTTTTPLQGNVDLTAPTLALTPQGTGSDTTPPVSGVTDAPVGSEVQISVTDSLDSTQTFSAVVQADGTFSADIPTALAEGQFTVTASVSDAAGNNTVQTEAGGNIDSQAPMLTIDNIGLTKDNTPQVSGNTDATPGSTVTLTATDSNGNSQNFTALVQGDGSFSVALPASMPDGNITITAQVAGPTGVIANTSVSATIDTTAPDLTLDNLPVTNDSTPLISGTVDIAAGGEVTLTVTDSNGDSQIFTATVAPDGTFSAPVPVELPDGAYSVTATVTDNAGNTASASAPDGEIDTLPATLELNVATAGNDTLPTVSGTSDAPAGTPVQIVLTDSAGTQQTLSATVQADGSFDVTATTQLAQGNYTIQASVSDSAGNITNTSASSTIDTIAPTLSLNIADAVNTDTPQIEGTTNAAPGSLVQLTVTDSNGVEQTLNVTVQNDGTFGGSMPGNLAEGDYTVTAQVNDAAGNITTVNGSGTVDTTAPVISLDAPGVGNDTAPVISGTSDAAPGSVVTLQLVDAGTNAQTFTATVQNNGTFSATPPDALVEGDFSVTAEVSDAAGNATFTSETGTVDITAPTLSLDNPGATNDATPPITGNTDAPQNTAVTLVVTDDAGASQTFTALVQADGSFSADVPANLSEGNFTVRAEIQDAAGNFASALTTGQLDTAPPVLTIATQTTTNDSTPLIAGTTDLASGADVTITVTDADSVVHTYTATVQADGSYSAAVPATLAQGSYQVSVSATDAAGNTVSVSDTGGSVDTLAPTLILTDQNAGNDPTPTITGTTDAAQGSVVSLTITDAAGASQALNTTVQNDGTFSADVATELAQGSYTIVAQVADAAGNITTVSDTTGVLDTQSPVLTLDTLDTANDSTPLISGTTDLPAASQITIQITDFAGDSQSFTATVESNGDYSATVPLALAEGEYTVTASGADAAGNVTTTSQTAVLDTTPPALLLDPMAVDNNVTPDISGSTDALAGSTVTVAVTDSTGSTQTFTAIVQPDGTFSAQVPAPLAEGQYEVAVQVSDGAGNVATNSQTATVDTQPPALTLAAQTTGNDTTPQISGSTDAPVNSTVTITVTDNSGNTQQFNATVQADGSFSAPVPATMAEGQYTVSAQVADAAGNIASTSETGGAIDTSAPSVTLDAIPVGNDTTPTISGSTTATPGALVEINVTDVDNVTQTMNAVVQEDGSFSVTVPAALAEGSFTVTAQTTDSAGNTGTGSISSELDITAPAISILAPGSGNDTTPQISGTTTAQEGQTVTITLTDNAGNSQQLTTVVQNDGTFSAAPAQALAEGNYTVAASVEDAAGNPASTLQSGNIDITAPTLSLDVPGQGNDTTPVISGNSDAIPGTVVAVTVTDALNAVQTINTLIQSDGSFSIEIAEIAEGDFTVTAQISDAAGNTTNATPVTGTLDTQPPAITLAPAGLGSDNTPDLSGTTDAEVGSQVIITVTDSDGVEQNLTTTVLGDGTFAVTVPQPLAEGSFTVVAATTDAAGNTATDTQAGTVDTIAPEISVTAQPAGNDPTPTITGSTTGASGQSVTITVTDSLNAEQTFTTTVAGDNSFSAQVPAALAEGDYSISVKVSDAAGNEAQASGTGTLDITPAELNLTPQGNTADSTPTISGTTDLPPGSTVNISVTDSGATTQNFSALVQADHTFSADVPLAMADGSYTVTVQATDAAGNSNTATDNSGNLDTSAPLIELDVIGATNDLTPQITGTTDADVGLTVTVTVTDFVGTTQVLTTTVDLDGSFTVTVPSPLVEGTFTVQAQVTDGTTSDAFITATADIQPPSLILDALPLSSDTPLISGVSDEIGATVTLTLTDVNGDQQNLTATVQSDGTFSVTPLSVPAGNLSVSASIIDAAGNLANTDINGIIDFTAPTVTLNTFDLNVATPVISGTSDEIGAQVTITLRDNGGNEQTLTTTVAPDGTFTVTPAAVVEGELTVTATLTDPAGNVTIDTRSATIDLSAPTISLNELDLTSATPSISGVSNEIGAQVTLTVTDDNGDVQNLFATVGVDGTFSVTPASLPEGNLSIAAAVADSAGNIGTTSISALLDFTAPTLALEPLDLSSAAPLITGTSDALGALVTITVTDANGDSQQLNATVNGDGTFSVTPSLLPEGALTITATVSDTAGNPVTVTLTGDIDLTAPSLILTPIDQTVASPVIAGTSDEIGATVTLTITDSDGATQILTATVDPGGNFSVIPAALPAGAVSIEASIADSAGNTTSTSLTTAIDLSAPTLVLNSLDLSDATPLISGTSDELGAVVTITLTDSEGQSQTLSATVQGDGTFSVTPSILPQGTVSITASVQDSAGNTTSKNLTGDIDLTLPTLVVAPLDATSDTPIISGTSDEIGATVSVQLIDSNGATQTLTTTVGIDGTFSVAAANVAQGPLAVDVSLSDLAGNVATQSVATVIDSVAPLLNLDTLILNTLTPVISGTSDAIGSTVTIVVTDINSVVQTLSTTVQPDGIFSIVPEAVAEGLLSIDVSVVDPAGNLATISTSGLVDITLPLLTIDPITAGTDTPLITGTSDEIGATVSLVLTDAQGNSQTLSALVQNDGTFGASPTLPVAEGLLNVNVTVLDATGNIATVSTTGLIDITAPLLTVNEPVLNDPTPVIAGTSDEIGGTVTVVLTDSLGAIQTLVTTVHTDGTFSIVPPSAVAEGLLNIDVSVVDSSGNLVNVTTSGLIDLSLPLVNLNAIDFTQAAPLITGTSDEIGGVVTVSLTDSLGNEQLLTTTVGNDGSFNVTPTSLPEGLLTVNVSVLDSAGNIGSVSTSGLIDLTLPLLTLDGFSLNDATPTITGTSDEIGATVTVLITDSANQLQTLTSVIHTDGTFAVTPPLAVSEGLLSIEVNVLDAAGNLASVTSSGLIDLTLPVINLGGIDYTSETPIISGTSDAIGAMVTVELTDGNSNSQSLTALVQSDGTFSLVPATLPEGLLTINASVLDAAGNLASVSTSGLIDLTLPVINLGAFDLNDATPTIQGTSDEIGGVVTVVLTDSAGNIQTLVSTIHTDGTFSVTPTTQVAQGLLNVDVTVLDSAGNLATVSTSGLIDLEIPTLTINLDQLNSATPTISGTSDEIGGTVNISLLDADGATQLLTAVVDEFGNFTVTPATVPQGLLNIDATVLDSAGNLATVSTSGLIDLEIPTLTINLDQLNSATPTISGTSDEIGGTVNISVLDSLGVTQTLSALVGIDGNFSVLAGSVPEGLLSVNASLLDTAGNVATVSTSGLIDLTIPVLSLDAIGLINDATPTLTGTTDEANATIDVVTTDALGNIQALSVLSDSAGDFTIEIPVAVAQGLLTIEASVADEAGNSGVGITTATIDTIAPNLEISSLPTLLSPVLTGFTDPSEAGRSIEVELTANLLGIETTLNISTTVLVDGSWSTGPIANLSVGPVSATVSITDAAGNLVSVSESSSASPSSAPEETSTNSGDIVTANLLSGSTTLDI